MRSLDKSEIKVASAKAGYDLTDSELISLKNEFDNACKVIRPLYKIDLSDVEMVLRFDPSIGADK